MMITDIALTAIRLTSCFMLANKMRSAWLLSICGAVLKIIILNSLALHILASSKCITLVLSIYAWLRWKSTPGEQKQAEISPKWLYIGLISICLIGFLNQKIWLSTISSQVVLSVLNLSAYLFAANRKKACWIVWIIYDILLIRLFIDESLYLSAIVTFLYIPIALFGNQKWQHNTNSKYNQRLSATPVFNTH